MTWCCKAIIINNNNSSFLCHLAAGLASHWEKHYLEVIYWIRAALAFALLRATVLCIRGIRTTWRCLGFEDGAIIDSLSYLIIMSGLCYVLCLFLWSLWFVCCLVSCYLCMCFPSPTLLLLVCLVSLFFLIICFVFVVCHVCIILFLFWLLH